MDIQPWQGQRGVGAGVYRAARFAWQNRQEINRVYQGAVRAFRNRPVIPGGRVQVPARRFGMGRLGARRGFKRPLDVTPRYRAGGNNPFKRSRGNKGFTIGAPAQYSGKFKGSVRRSKTSKVAKFGHRKESEVHGTVRANNVARMAVSAFPVDDMLVSVWISVLRYYMKRYYQVEYYDVNNIFLPAGTTSSLTLTIEYQVRDAKNTVTVVQNSIPYLATDSLSGVAARLALGDINYRTSVPQYRVFPVRLRCSASTSSLLSQWQRIDTVVIKVYGKAEVNIQNQTRTSTSATSDQWDLLTDNVNANPISGNIVFGRGISPQVNNIDLTGSATSGSKFSNWPFGYETQGKGVILSAEAPDLSWKAVQPASQFVRSTHSRSFVLQPGEVKRFDVGYTWTGYFKTFILNYARGYTENPADAPTSVNHQGADVDGSLNRWALVQAEKIIQFDATVGTEAETRLGYQVDFHFGSCVKKGPRSLSMNVDFAERRINAIEV